VQSKNVEPVNRVIATGAEHERCPRPSSRLTQQDHPDSRQNIDYLSRFFDILYQNTID
jgi:hypothetical protein